MYGHQVIVTEMEAWWAEHGGRHDDPAWLAFLDDYFDLLRSKLSEMREEHDNKGRFGMSKAGGCTRAAVLKLQEAEAAPLSGSTRVTFWNGHMVEVLGIATLRAIGLPVSPAGQDGKQWACSIDPMMHSYTDGVIAPDPRLDNTETLLTVKSAGYKMSGYNYQKKEWKYFGFAQFPYDGVKKAVPSYWAQAQAEMRGANRSQSLLLVVAKDLVKKVVENAPVFKEHKSGSFYAELIHADTEWADTRLIPTWQAAWQAHESGLLPHGQVITSSGEYVLINPADPAGNKLRTGTYNVCDYCDLSDACMSAQITSKLAASLNVAEAV